MQSGYRSIPDNVCELIPVLYSLSPTFIDADNVSTIELGLLVSDLLFQSLLTHTFKCRFCLSVRLSV